MPFVVIDCVPDVALNDKIPDEAENVIPLESVKFP